jgi:hypothetical protein
LWATIARQQQSIDEMKEVLERLGFHLEPFLEARQAPEEHKPLSQSPERPTAP